MDKIKLWILKHKLEFLLLLAILFIASFCRLYKIDEYMTFLGDEGRDVIIARKIFVNHHPPLIGPGTSIGNMYLGPAYYYMIALPLLIANFNPVGPAIFIAILGVATVFLLWYVAREWFPAKNTNLGALAAAFLFAVSPVVIIYSRSSWNPNIMPFFSLLTIYSAWKAWIGKNYKWLVITGVSFAFVLQSHYLGLLLLPTLIIMWSLMFIPNLKAGKKSFLTYSFVSFFLFIVIMSPLAIFDLRHNFINFKAIKSFFTNRESTVSVLPWKAIPNIWPITNTIATDLSGAGNAVSSALVSVIILLSSIYVYFVKREKYNFRSVSIFITITSWLGFGLIGLSLYKQHIYDHYFGFVFAVPSIILAGVINFLVSKKNKLTRVVASALISYLILVNLQNSPLRQTPNRQLERTIAVSQKVKELSGGEKFNFALIAENNYDSAYRYFLNLNGANVVDIDPQNAQNTITKTLIVVCETDKSKCDPTHNPKAEIANFGWSKIDKEFDNVMGVKIYKLVHSQ